MKFAGEVRSKAGLSFIGNLFGKLILLISSVLFGMLLGPGIYGSFTFIVSTLSIFMVFGNLGLTMGLNAFIPRYEKDQQHKRDSIITFSILAVIILNTIIVILLFFSKELFAATFFKSHSDETLFLILLPTLILLNGKNVLQGIFKALRDVRSFIMSSNIVIHVSSLGFFLLLYALLGKKIDVMVGAYYLSLLTTWAYLIAKLKTLKVDFQISRSYFAEYKQLIFFSFPLLLNAATLVLIHNIDILMIGTMLDSTKVGIYKMAVNMGNVSTFGLMSVNSIFPAITTSLYHQNKMQELKGIYREVTVWTSLFSLLILSGTIVLGRTALTLVGDDYVLGSTALIVIALGQLVNSIAGPVGTINAMTGNPKYNLLSNTLACLINVVLNLIFIPRWGITGGAFATALSLGLSNLLRLILAYRSLQMHPYTASYFKILIPFTGSLLAGLSFTYLSSLKALWQFLSGGFLVTSTFALLTYAFVLTEESRRSLLNKLHIHRS